MKRTLLILAVVLVVGFGIGRLSAWLLTSTPPIPQRAVAAYNAGHYQEALPLLKEWASLPDVRTSNDKRALPLAYIQDTESRLATPTPLPPLSPNQLLAQAKASLQSPSATPANTPAITPSDTQPAGFAAGDPLKGPNRTPHTKPSPGQTVVLSIKELGNFEFNPNTDTDVPPDVKLLEGATLRLSGFMIPQNQSDKITDFALVPSLLSCCFGSPPGVEHVIMCHTLPDHAIDYAIDEIEITGTLHINPKRQEDFTYSLFEFEVHSAKVKE